MLTKHFEMSTDGSSFGLRTVKNKYMWFHKYGPCCTLSTCSLHSCLVDSLSAYLIFESQHALEDMLQPCPDMYFRFLV